MLALAENVVGAAVAVIRLPNDVAGAYLRQRGQPFVFINGDYPVVRQRFTVAHELGHHELAHQAVIDGIDQVEGRTSDPQEQQANFFAGVLLAPEEAMLAWLDDEGDPEIDAAVLASMAARLGVSGPALLVRLEQESILQKSSQITRLRRDVDRGAHLAAAKAYGIPAFNDELQRLRVDGTLPRLPKQLRDNALSAYAAGLIDLDGLAGALRRPREEVERLVAEYGITPPAPESDW